ncbi:MAG: type II toxin-antitoxin system RelE/ParE family toxin [Clostridiales bacterium]|nr:type II toxin-antitoxin system RelE/ParE family toxin [Clostridiales bacterium]
MSKKIDFRFLPSALKDIDEVFDYITQKLCNQKAANDLMGKLDETIDNIRLFPQSFPLHEDSELKSNFVRKVSVDNYILFYKYDEAQELIIILYFKYGGSNLSGLH